MHNDPNPRVPIDWDAVLHPLAHDDLPPGQRWSTYDAIGVLTGPEPVPEWLVTADAAIDHELGVIKSGKEADAHLIERAVPDGPTCLLVAKRYRDLEHRLFQRDQGYTEGRGHRDSREARAIKKGTRFGRQVAGLTWAAAEFEYLGRLYEAGVPVPYPVQLDGRELLMEFIQDADGEAAPRLAQLRPAPEPAAGLGRQIRAAMAHLASLGWAHGDLSPYNVLVRDGEAVVIDVPQVVDLVVNPRGTEYLLRDCHAICRWLSRCGVLADEQEWFADLVGRAW